MLRPNGEQGEDVKNESRRKPQPGIATCAASPEGAEGGDRQQLDRRKRVGPGLVLCPGILLGPLLQTLHPLLDLIQAAILGRNAARDKARDPGRRQKDVKPTYHV